MKNNQHNKIIDLDDIFFVPKKKKRFTFTKKPFLKYCSFLIVLVLFIFGVSYSFFTYYSESSRETTISPADIYVKVLENKVSLNLSNMYPMTATEARARNDNYVTFTLVGKNTSEMKQLIYSLLIENGDNVSGKTRIAPTYVSFDLEEYVSGSYVSIVSDTPLANFSFSDSVLPETNTEIERVFRLRVWVNDTVLISDTEPNATYTQSEFANLYATYNVSVTSYDAPPPSYGIKMVRAAINAKQNAETNSCNPVFVDDMGTTSDETDDIIYFSGTNSCVDMNYVWYSGKLWRIVVLYPDGAMKLVTENAVSTLAFNPHEQVDFYTDVNTSSYMYQWLNEDFYDTLYNINDFIDTTKEWNATIMSNNNRPATTTMVSSNVGLLDRYEYYNSYRCINNESCTGTSYGDSFLNIDYSWLLLSPTSSAKINIVELSGYISNIHTDTGISIRPSIVIKSNLEFTGNGTSTNPYKIKGDKESGNVNELINTRMSGEYVKLKNGDNEQLFRIVEIEDSKTKIIAMDYADNSATRIFATSSGNTSDARWGEGTTTGTDTWYTYLNDTYYPNLVYTYGNIFDSGTYYLAPLQNKNYKTIICANASSETTKECAKTSYKGTFDIGLSRYAEFFSAQQSNGNNNSINMRLINRTNNNVFYIRTGGTINYNEPTELAGARPTVHLKSTVKIISGSGTQSDPYVVGL